MVESFDISPRLARRHVGLKLLAAALAFLTWYTIREETSYEQTVRGVTIEIKTPAGWALNGRSTDSADVLLRGSRSDLRGLTREDLRIEADLPKSDASKTNVVLKLSPKNVRAPAGMRALRVVPSTIYLRIEPKP
jgi:hypothetical protein